MKYPLKEILDACIYACDEEALLSDSGECRTYRPDEKNYAEKLRLAIDYLRELKEKDGEPICTRQYTKEESKPYISRAKED